LNIRLRPARRSIRECGFNEKIIVILVAFVAVLSCEKRFTFIEYDEDNKPSVSQSKKLINDTLKGIAYDSASVEIHSVNEGKYSKRIVEHEQEMGWIMLCDFSWTGLHNIPERQRWWFSIRNNLAINIVDDQDWANNFYYNNIK
jgi:hypothetical protein